MQEERSGGLTGADRSRADRKRDQPTDMNVVENSRKDLRYTMHEGRFGNWGNMSSREGESCRLELARRTAGQGGRVVEREESFCCSFWYQSPDRLHILLLLVTVWVLGHSL